MTDNKENSSFSDGGNPYEAPEPPQPPALDEPIFGAPDYKFNPDELPTINFDSADGTPPQAANDAEDTMTMSAADIEAAPSTVPVTSGAAPHGVEASVPQAPQPSDDRGAMPSEAEPMPPAQSEVQPSSSEPPFIPPSIPPSAPSEEDDMPKKRSHKKAWIAATVIVLLLIIAGASTAYALYYKNKALPHTVVGNVAVGGMTKAQIAQKLQQTQDSAKLTFSGDVKDAQPASLKDVGVKVFADKTADKVMKANDSVWPYVKQLFTTRKVEPIYFVDRHTLADYTHKMSLKVDSQSAMVIEPTVQAKKDNSGFHIVKGTAGKGLEPRNVLAIAEKAINTMKSASGPVKMVGIIKPLITQKELEPIMKKAEDMVPTKVDLKVGDKTVTATDKDKVQWVELPGPGLLLDPSANLNNVTQWVADQSGAVTVQPVNGYAYVTESGKVLKTETHPKDGVKVTNAGPVSKEIMKDFLEHKAYNGALKTAVDKAETKKKIVADGAENLPYWASPDEVWIDVNVGGRLLTVYKGAKVLRGPMGIVPGDSSHPTVRGTFKIWYRTRIQTMSGPGYTTPNVEFNSFFHQGYAIHAAYWRSAFGPGTGGGSHGCVNMARSDAEWIYNNTNIGTVVVSRN